MSHFPEPFYAIQNISVCNNQNQTSAVASDGNFSTCNAYFPLGQWSGAFLTERAMEDSYLKVAFHESHTIGHWCHMGPQNLLIRHKLSNSGYMTTEDDTSGNFGRPFRRYSLLCSALKKVC